MTANAAPTRTTGRVAHVALWALQVLVALAYALAAYLKLSSDPSVLAGIALTGMPLFMVYVIGSFELAGAIGVLVPRLVGVAALGLVTLMVLATIITVAAQGWAMAAIPAAYLVVVSVLAWGRRSSTRTLVADVRARLAH